MDKSPAFVRWLDVHRDRCFDLLRIYLGVGLFIKGAIYASDPSLLEAMTAGDQLRALPAIALHGVVTAHLVGGLLMAIGLLTRLAALIQVPILAGAIWFVHLHEGLFTRSQNLEFTILVLFLLLLVAAHGPGKWSVDHAIDKKQRRLALAHTAP